MIYWMIGQPGAGKTTLAKRLKNEFDAKGNPCIHLDGDDLRKIFSVPYENRDSFTREYRAEQTKLLQNFVSHISDQGVDVIVSTVNPYRKVRDEFKSSRKDVVEIFVETKDLRGREHLWIKDFEEPSNNFISIRTGNGRSEEESFKFLYSLL